MSTYYLVFIVYLLRELNHPWTSKPYIPTSFYNDQRKNVIACNPQYSKIRKMQNIREIATHQIFSKKCTVWQDFRALCYPLLCVYYILYYFKGIVLHTCISIYTFLRLHTITTYLLPKYISIYLYLWYLCDRIAASS